MIFVRSQNLLVKNLKKFIFISKKRILGIELDANEALSLIRTAIREQTDDHAHESELTVDQYSTLMLRYVGSSELDDELRQTFNALDRDHDGRITREDFDKLRYENSFFDHLDVEQYELIIKELLIQANNNNNGIDFNQFVNLMMHQ
jgi:Ca2+-binding EF-hand superfamily protein